MSHVIAMIQQYGLGFVFLNVLALQAGLPIPAYPTLIVAGAYAASGGNPLWALILVGIAAAIVDRDDAPVAALSVSAPTERLPASERPAVIEAVLSTAAHLAESIGRV